MENMKPISMGKSILLFAIPSAYFILLTSCMTPFLEDNLDLHPSLSWYITGYFVFVPLFLSAIFLVKKEKGMVNLSILKTRLRFGKLTKNDVMLTIVGTGLSLFGLGAIWGISQLLTIYCSVPPLQTTPSFMSSSPLVGAERLYLLLWLPMFFFNIVGEQMLWQGYILPRQELTHGKWAFLWNTLCWLLFHLCFGLGLMILLSPLLILIPYTIQRTQNTTTGVIIHAVINGPMAVVIALGLIK